MGNCLRNHRIGCFDMGYTLPSHENENQIATSLSNQSTQIVCNYLYKSNVFMEQIRIMIGQ